VWMLNSKLIRIMFSFFYTGTWAIPPVSFVIRFFEIGSPRLFAWGWLWTMILMISASWVARIIGVSYQCQAFYFEITPHQLEEKYTTLSHINRTLTSTTHKGFYLWICPKA
jgi:hypothetical protein